MAGTDKLSSWIKDNVPDDSEWGEYYITVWKEELQSGGKVQITRTIQPPRDAIITGKEIKDDLAFASSPVLGIVLTVLGLLLIAYKLLLAKPQADGAHTIGIGVILAIICIAAGIYLLVKSRKAGPEISSITSMDALEPFIEKSLGKKVLGEEHSRRQKEKGEAGRPQYFCIPARYAAQGKFDKKTGDLGLPDEMLPQLTAAARELPEECRVLSRRK